VRVSECIGYGCTHPDHGAPEQYGNSLHWPHCIDRSCTGCLPPLDEPLRSPPKVDPTLTRWDRRAAARVAAKAERKARWRER
jgi:hypothetical protein